MLAPPQSAITYLREAVENLRTGVWLPGYFMSVHEIEGKHWSEFRRVLMEEYGWPDEFREHEWAQVCQELAERALEAAHGK